jgi:hypothetical protein
VCEFETTLALMYFPTSAAAAYLRRRECCGKSVCLVVM